MSGVVLIVIICTYIGPDVQVMISDFLIDIITFAMQSIENGIVVRGRVVACGELEDLVDARAFCGNDVVRSSIVIGNVMASFCAASSWLVFPDLSTSAPPL